jgi:DNA-binding GntR family transcriptional regulator
MIVEATHNDYLELAMTPLQSLSRRFRFAHIPDVAEHLGIAADLHGSVLRAVAHGDEAEAVGAAQRLTRPACSRFGRRSARRATAAGRSSSSGALYVITTWSPLTRALAASSRQ